MKSMLRTLACVSTVALVGLLLAVPTFAALDPADIIAIWLFDEGEGGIVEDASGNPHDMDGTLEGGHWGVNPGEKPKWVDGKFGKALKCEGEGSVISIPNFIKDERLGPDEDDEAAGDLPDETAITITAWVQRNDKIGSAAQKDLFSYEPGGPWDQRILVHFPWDDGAGEFIMWQYGKPPQRGHWWFPANGGEMNHYAFTGNSEETVIYLNGEFMHRGPGAKPFIRTDEHGPWHICGRFGSSAQVTVDDIGVFSRVLSEDEISSIMREGLAVAAALDVEPAEKLSTTWGVIKTSK
jgi:hypothetical protein